LLKFSLLRLAIIDQLILGCLYGKYLIRSDHLVKAEPFGFWKKNLHTSLRFGSYFFTQKPCLSSLLDQVRLLNKKPERLLPKGSKQGVQI
jgi:hypothetical protein